VRNPFAALFERRSVGTSSELYELLTRGTRSTSGASVTEQTALNVAAVWTGVAIRSRLLSTLPLDVIEQVGDRVTRQVPQHPVARVLSQPNSWQTRSELIAMLEVHRVLRGNAYAWVNRAVARVDGILMPHQPNELIPMHPDQVEVLEVDWRAPTQYVLHKQNGESVPLPGREVLHLKNLSTNGRSGRPFLRDMREVIGGALATQDHANSLWSRDATPSVALRHPKALSAQAKDGLEKSWEATYGRSSEKRRVAVLEEGMEIQQLSLTPEDGQFLQTQQDLRSQIAAALFVPPHLMGLSEKATSWGTGIEQQNIGLRVFSTGPDAVTWEERLTRDLISDPSRYRVKFNVNGFMRGDSTARSNFYGRMVQMGAMSPNDVRALEDLNPIPDGDIYLQPVNMVPLGWEPAPKDATV
jgi:HK97 family phage portal protein